MSVVPAELLVRQDQSLQSDGEAHVTARHHVLDLKVQEAGREAQFLDHPSVLPGRQPGVFFTGEAGQGSAGVTAEPRTLAGDLTDLLAPVQTIFPELKISAVVLGSRILMMTAAKRWKRQKAGLYLRNNSPDHLSINRFLIKTRTQKGKQSGANKPRPLQVPSGCTRHFWRGGR